MHLNPADFIISLKSSCLGNFRILSTRYWYGCHWLARICPIGGITWKEYWSYALWKKFRISWSLRIKTDLLPSKIVVRDVTEFQTQESSSWLQHAVSFGECLKQFKMCRSWIYIFRMVLLPDRCESRFEFQKLSYRQCKSCLQREASPHPHRPNPLCNC